MTSTLARHCTQKATAGKIPVVVILKTEI